MGSPTKCNDETSRPKTNRGAERMHDRARDDEEELERRQSEALREWRKNGEARKEFGRDVGKIEHQDWRGEMRRLAESRGHKEGKDYAIEYTLRHPDGSTVRYDFVDFRNHHIIDRKPATEGEKELAISKRYLDQQRRYIEAYRAKFGAEPTFEYSLYSSTKNMPSPADGNGKKK